MSKLWDEYHRQDQCVPFSCTILYIMKVYGNGVCWMFEGIFCIASHTVERHVVVIQYQKKNHCPASIAFQVSHLVDFSRLFKIKPAGQTIVRSTFMDIIGWEANFILWNVGPIMSKGMCNIRRYWYEIFILFVY